VKTSTITDRATDWIPAAPFRAHVRHVIEVAEIPWQVAAVEAGVSLSLVQHLLWGRTGRVPSRIAPAAAARLLRLTASDLAGLHRGMVPATETTRRLRELLAAGWAPDRLAGFCRLRPTELAALVEGDTVGCTRLTESLVRAAERLLPGGGSVTAAA
jgi:hypothetical protein